MKRRLGIAIAMLGSISMLFSATAMAGVTVSETIPGNYRCERGDTKIDPVAAGEYALAGGGHIHIRLLANKEFAFEAHGAEVSSIVVKGGPNHLLWTFSPAVESYSGLHAPLNLNNGKWYGLSHLCIASDKKDAPDPQK